MCDTYSLEMPIHRDLHDEIMLEMSSLKREWELMQALRPEQCVLDIGCGPASLSLPIACMIGAEGSVIGLDNNFSTLQYARTLARQYSHTNLLLICGNAYGLPFRNLYFDVVFFRHVLMHLTDVKLALLEAIRVTRYGGQVIAHEEDAETWRYYPCYTYWDRLFSTVRERLSSPFVGRELQPLFQAIGLKNITVNSNNIVVTDKSFQEHILTWLRVFESSRSYLTKLGTWTTGDFDHAMIEGRELMHRADSFFCYQDYEIMGYKA